MDLRPYQQQIIEDARRAMAQGKRRICIVLPCGGGKSVIAAHIAKRSISKGNHVLFFVHRKELCEQIFQTFIECGVDMNYCTVGMQQTITRHLEQVSMFTPGLIICDEFHHALAAGYRNIFDSFPNTPVVGFTATPIRMNEGGLGDVCDELITSVSTKWLIENHYLSPCKCYSAPLADLSGVKINHGEYDVNQMAAILENNTVYGETIRNYQRLADGKKTIAYCVSVAAAKQTAALFQENGYKAAALDGSTPKVERQAVMQQFRDGEITILCNCELFGEGLDVPDVECVILLRKTHSLTMYIQQAMRSMRYKPDKTAIIIDHVGNIFEHGFPQEEREWSLETKRKAGIERQEIDATPKTCPNCGVLVAYNAQTCPNCGFEFWLNEPQQTETVDVDLKEMTEEDLLRSKPHAYYQSCQSWDELNTFRRAKGYKPMWAVYKAIECKIDIPPQFKKLKDYALKALNADSVRNGA